MYYEAQFAETEFVHFHATPPAELQPAPAEGFNERRLTERLALAVPIRVMGFDEGRGEVFEDSQTIDVSRSGARLALRHRVYPGDVIRIINLENNCEADFRIVGPARLVSGEAQEWGVECVERDRCIWELDIPAPPPREPGEAPLLECRGCGAQEPENVTPMETFVLESTGIIARYCAPCRIMTYWTYAEASLRPRTFSAHEPVAPPPVELRQKVTAEKRQARRLNLQLPVLLWTQAGTEEAAETANISIGGVALALELELRPGEIVSLFCPFTRDGQNIEQRAEVRWADPYPSGRKRFYGLRFLR